MPTSLDRRRFVSLLSATAAASLLPARRSSAQAPARRPNVVLVFTDDQGYGDLSCYGQTRFQTPRIDSLAADGMRFTDFYCMAPVCSASRAALLTGCYPRRVGIVGALGPRSAIGLNPDEVTLAELLQAQGYATGCFGKWHLGDHESMMPWRQGFDTFYGLPYSNDMWPWHYAHSPAGPRLSRYPDLPLYDGREVIELNPDQDSLTRRYTTQAVRFIERHAAEPFFCYLPHSMPHIPLGVAPERAGSTAFGRYGDVIEEIDWSVGEVLATLDRLGLRDDTLVLYSSDNGPWLPFGDHAGTTGGLREGKGTIFEGGVRMPCLARWPGRIPAGTVCSEVACTMDILPTVTRLAGTAPPGDRVIDGRDIWPLLSGEPEARSPHEALFFHNGNALRGVRSGDWKLVLPHQHRHQTYPAGTDGKRAGEVTASIELSLFNLAADPAETTNLAEQQPAEVARLQALAEAHEAELVANTRAVGRAQWPPRPVTVVTASPDGSYDLQAVWAEILGPGTARYVADPERRNIGHWGSLEQSVRWQVAVAAAGRYRVEVVQAVVAEQAGSRYRVEAADQKLSGVVQPTAGWTDYLTVDLGIMTLPAGQLAVTVVPETKGAGAVMNLRAVRLVPAD